MAVQHDDENRVVIDDRSQWADAELPAERRMRTEHIERVEPERVVVRKNSVGQSLRIMLATVLVVAVVAFAALNTDEVTVDFGFDTLSASLAAIVGGTAAAGFLVGWLLGFRGRRDVDVVA
jgi:uncharacterized integral membrane protein